MFEDELKPKLLISLSHFELVDESLFPSPCESSPQAHCLCRHGRVRVNPELSLVYFKPCVWQAEIDPTGTQFSQLPLYMYEYDWVIMRAPRLLNLFPVPIIIDDDRDERQIPPPMLLTFRTRAPSTELSLRPPQPAREFFQF
ncbi:hypothetical protein LR48_Vigan107s003400 [Vigna angularis]|uniref:Uncharacterized protein n=1 Tax=Phaseolus angularis TaxID=3914 RepID=A0A0L9T4J1_PHAAN|nr:hypothetical protein LR48_Vigan107s003400 [Vigna angularis]